MKYTVKQLTYNINYCIMPVIEREIEDTIFMKKAFLLLCVLSISVITTACINNFAVQELNNKAMTLLEEGNYDEAIVRLKSSIDLDDSVFESHYNLAVAYTKAEDYINAMKSYQKAITLKPNFADSYYSLAVAEENLAIDLSAGILVLDENGELKKAEQKDSDEEDENGEIILTDAEKTYIKTLQQDAVKNYNLYLSKAEKVDDADGIQKRIADLEAKIDPVNSPSNTEAKTETAQETPSENE